MIDKRIQWDCRLAKVKFLKSVCSHKRGQIKIVPLTRAKRYERKGRVEILKVIDKI